MKFKEWLDGERGRRSSVAAHFSVSMSAISQWVTNGVPIDRMRDVRDISRGAVSLDDMLPERPELIDPPSAPAVPAVEGAA